MFWKTSYDCEDNVPGKTWVPLLQNHSPNQEQMIFDNFALWIHNHQIIWTMYFPQCPNYFMRRTMSISICSGVILWFCNRAIWMYSWEIVLTVPRSFWTKHLALDNLHSHFNNHTPFHDVWLGLVFSKKDFALTSLVLMVEKCPFIQALLWHISGHWNYIFLFFHY